MMRPLLSGIVVGVALIASLTGTAFAKDSRVLLGTISRIQGEARAAYGPDERNLLVGDSIYQNDTLRTGEDSRLLVRLTDGSDLTLGAKAGMLVSDVIASPDQDRGPVMSLLNGVFALAAVKTKGAEIKTPVATIGIRGTKLWGGPLSGALDVLLLEGKIDVTTPQGSVTLDQAGQGTVISAAGQAPGAVGMWPESKVAKAVETVTFR